MYKILVRVDLPELRGRRKSQTTQQYGEWIVLWYMYVSTLVYSCTLGLAIQKLLLQLYSYMYQSC